MTFIFHYKINGDLLLSLTVNNFKMTGLIQCTTLPSLRTGIIKTDRLAFEPSIVISIPFTLNFKLYDSK